MSNIYIQEPPALGKVLLKTSVGDIDLELWTKEAPKACRNFIQLCMEGYYNGTIFHRVVPDFIVQGGDPKGDGTGGESIYGGTFKDEFHSRLRFNRRGLVAMANAGKDDNGSQFFFTLNTTPELQNKHTIFAKVTGETIFNMIKLAEGLTDQDDRPLYPHKIISTQVLIDPYGDIVPRVVEKTKEGDDSKKKKKRDKTGVKNFGLLSFGMEAEEEEDQSTEYRGKPKSTHDVLDDPKLSRLTALDVENEEENPSSSNKVMDEATVAAVNSIRDKLQAKSRGDPKKDSREIDKKTQEKSGEKSDDEIEEYYLGKDRIEARKKQAEEIRGQIRDLKREMSGKKASESENANAVKDKPEDKKSENEIIQDFELQQEKYRKMKEDVPKKGTSRGNLSNDKPTEKKPWVKNLYENTGHYPDNYTDVRFLEQMMKNVNIEKFTFLECCLGLCRLTHKVSTCVLFCVLFTYLYNEWATIETVFCASCALSFFGYLTFLIARYNFEKNNNEKEPIINKLCTSSLNNTPNFTIEKEKDTVIDKMFENSIKNSLKKSLKKKHSDISSNFKIKSAKKKSSQTIDNSITCLVYGDLKTVLIFLVFGYIVSPTLHTLTDTVSTDTIFATTACMMIVHIIFSDYGLSVAIVSNSLSINAAIFASICLASRLSNAFHAFVLISVAVQCFVLSPILIKLILHTRFAVVFFILTTLAAFISLWSVSMTLFYFFMLAVLFINVYCPILFVKWQKYKDNIYGPWDEAIVHDSDDIEECIALAKAS